MAGKCLIFKQKNLGNYGMINYISKIINQHMIRIYFLLFCFPILFTGCSRDEFINCNCQGKENNLCREIIFKNNTYIGNIQYSYNSFDSVSLVEYISNISNSKKSIIFKYNSLNQLLSKEYYNFNNNYDIQTYNYNGNQIANEYFISNTDTIITCNYYYDNNLLIRIDYFSSNSIDSSVTWSYYTDNKLRCKTHFENNNILKQYSTYEYFSNNIDKISVFDSNNILTSYFTIKKKNNQITEIFRTKDDTTYLFQSFEYFNNNLLKTKISYNKKGDEENKTHYLYPTQN